MSALRVVCFDFDGTLGYMDPPHVRLYIRAAAEHATTRTPGAHNTTRPLAWDVCAS